MWIDLPCALCVPPVRLAPNGTAVTRVPSPFCFRVKRVIVNRETSAGAMEPVLWPWPAPPTRWQRVWCWLRRLVRRTPRGVEVLVAVGGRRARFDARDFHGHLDLGLVEKGMPIEIEMRNRGAERGGFEIVRLAFEGVDVEEEARRARLQRDARDTLDHLRRQLEPVWATPRRERDDE